MTQTFKLHKLDIDASLLFSFIGKTKTRRSLDVSLLFTTFLMLLPTLVISTPRAPPHPQTAQRRDLTPLIKLNFPSRGGGAPRDLHQAAQTLYDLRGFNIPLGGTEDTQRYLRQNDPFSFTRNLQPFSHRNSGSGTGGTDHSRTAPLVFPSFYQQNDQSQASKRPQTVLNIFGHTQHLSQTKYEPASASGQHGPQTFRPSQIDIGFNQKNLQQQQQQQNVGPFKPQPLFAHQAEPPNQLQGRQVQQAAPQPQQQPTEEPFIYVYDDEDYDEGEEDFVDKPDIKNNLITTTPTPTASPLIRAQPQQQQQQYQQNQIFPTNRPQTAPVQQQQQHQGNHFFQQYQPLQQQLQGNVFFNQHQHQQQQQQNQQYQQQQQQQQQQHQNPFSDYQFPPSLRFTPTTTPNVEIVPSSERKPPPDQSNAIAPVIQPTKPSRIVTDDRFRRPNQYQLLPAAPTQQQQQQQPQYNNQITQEEDEYEDEPNQTQLLQQHYNNYQQQERPETKLRPVNTLVPKNRIPQEDIVLPPNFPFHEDIRVSTSSDAQGTRGDVLRNSVRPSQFPPFPHQTPSTEATTVSPNTRGRGTPAPTLPSFSRFRGASNPPFRSTTTTTTEQSVEQEEEPKRIRTRPPPVPRVSPSTTRRPPPPPTTRYTTTTTTTTTTTPRTTTTTEQFYEDGEEYYEDDYEEERPGVSRPQQKVVAAAGKSPRPDLSNARPQNQIRIEEVSNGRVRGSSQSSSSSTPTPNPFASPTTPKGVRPSAFRGENPAVIELPPRKTTTGKPLYYAGKMLSKEGGLYAGQSIPSTHVYGYPVPNIPINSVMNRIPSSFADGAQSPVRGKGQRVRGGGGSSSRDGGERAHTTPATRTSTHQNSRLIHPSRIRPTGTSPAPFTTSTTQQPSDAPQPQPPPRVVRPSPKFIRPTSNKKEEDPGADAVETDTPFSPPPRRKIRPGQKPRRKPGGAAASAGPPPTPIVSTSFSEEENEDELDRPEPARKNLRPNLRPKQQFPQPIVQVVQTQSFSSTESSSTEGSTSTPSVLPSFRPRRPRPAKRLQAQPTTSESGGSGNDELNANANANVVQEETNPNSSPRPRRVRPRPRPRPTIPQPEADTISEVTQSARINKRPTEGPNRFSSKFREEPSPKTSTASTVSEITPEPYRHFSPPPKSKPRPTFKPPSASASKLSAPKSAGKRLKPSTTKPPPEEDPDDSLPPSIRLSAKDVVINRKPARRIPPGSASDRLKALQERRKRIGQSRPSTPKEFRESQRAGQQAAQTEEEEEDESPRTLRRRKLLGVNRDGNAVLEAASQKQQRRVVLKKRVKPAPSTSSRPTEAEEEEEEEYPAEGAPEHRELREEEDADADGSGSSLHEQVQNKREIPNREAVPLRPYNELDYEAEEKTNEEQKQQQQQQMNDNYYPNRGLLRRNPSEVSSDEARSVLGILIKREDEGGEKVGAIAGVDEDYEGHSSHNMETKVSTESPAPIVQDASVDPSSSSTESSSSSSSSSTEADASSTAPSSTPLSSRLRPKKQLSKQSPSESRRHTALSKLLKFRTSSSTYAPINSDSKLLKMATEDPSLPLEQMFKV